MRDTDTDTEGKRRRRKEGGLKRYKRCGHSFRRPNDELHKKNKIFQLDHALQTHIHQPYKNTGCKHTY